MEEADCGKRTKFMEEKSRGSTPEQSEANVEPSRGSMEPNRGSVGRSIEPTGGQSGEGGVHTSVVASHYNALEQKGLIERTKSRIYYMRNFNNWVKACVISDVIRDIRQQHNSSLRVLDLCCGKGGDLLKWKQGHIDHLVAADIAQVSVQQCQERYESMGARGGASNRFTAQFITADCSRQRLRDFYDGNQQFDLTSCQFSFHYSFESLQQAEMMMKNACEDLKPGGYFLLSIPSANELVKRARLASDKGDEATDLSFGNSIYSVKFANSNGNKFPLFGCRYDFTLEEVVNCPEFLVFEPVLTELAAAHSMTLVWSRPFGELFHRLSDQPGGHRALLSRIQALEPYPEDSCHHMSQSGADQYQTAERIQRQRFSPDQDPDSIQWNVRLGTISRDEWEAITLYNMLLFRRDG